MEHLRCAIFLYSYILYSASHLCPQRLNQWCILMVTREKEPVFSDSNPTFQEALRRILFQVNQCLQITVLLEITGITSTLWDKSEKNTAFANVYFTGGTCQFPPPEVWFYCAWKGRQGIAFVWNLMTGFQEAAPKDPVFIYIGNYFGVLPWLAITFQKKKSLQTSFVSLKIFGV